MKTQFKITDEQIADGSKAAYVRLGHNAYFGNGFKAGVEFALSLVNGAEQSDNNCNIPLVINWVAVKDELPNQGDEVLTITEDGWYRVMTFGSTGRRFPAQVTHWQRLPKPPCL